MSVIDVEMAQATIDHFTGRDWATLADDELQALNDAGFTVVCAVINERARREEATC